ncbi:hypothetical protein WM014_00105 [Bifidobacterium mongoliense]|uniref:hypothetical protein n=1 Tax=Bifidobacterium mongoliense TaxID=518643 RepID=UPI0030ECFB45
MITTHGEADFTIEYAKDRVRVTVELSGRQTAVTMPATTAMELSRTLAAQSALAMTEEA